MTSRISLYARAMRVKHSWSYILLVAGSIFFVSRFFSLPVSLGQSARILVVMMLYFLYSFCSNNFFDKGVDRLDPIKRGRNPYAAGDVSGEEMISMNVLLLSAMFLLAWIWFPGQLLLLAVLTLDITLYSRYLKRKPVVDLASHFIWIFGFFLFPALALGLRADTALSLWPLFLGLSNLTILEWNQVFDLEIDERAGIITTAVYFGKKVSKSISYASIFMILAFIIWFSNDLRDLLPLTAIPILVLITFRIRGEDVGRWADWAILTYAILAGAMAFLFPQMGSF